MELGDFEFIETKRAVNPNSLLGLMWRLKRDAEFLDRRIKGLEKKLGEHGIPVDGLRLVTAKDVALLLQRRQAAGHSEFVLNR